MIDKVLALARAVLIVPDNVAKVAIAFWLAGLSYSMVLEHQARVKAEDRIAILEQHEIRTEAQRTAEMQRMGEILGEFQRWREIRAQEIREWTALLQQSQMRSSVGR